VSGPTIYGYVKGNPLSRIDPTGLATLQIGIAGTATGGVFGGLVGTGIAIDSSGNIAVYSYGGAGAGVGLNEGAGVSVQASNAQTVQDLSGPFLNTSVSGGVVVGGTLDGFTGPSDHGQVWGGGFTVGEDVGASVLIGGTVTAVSRSFNPISWLREKLSPYDKPCQK